MENNLSFEQLPNAVFQLYEKLNSIENLLLNKTNQPETDQLLTIQEAGELIKLSVPTLYGYVSRNDIPFSKKGKRLYFSKQELINRVKTRYKKIVLKIKDGFNNKPKPDRQISSISELWVKFLLDILKGVIKGVILYYICK
ncbi:MAG: helix-turn-helix domain-containing protein [Bacteroidota bacterium]|nr:helix-turn-helix domain-containing protein [Bacteroidota bacterium]